ncbi:hypothetical protein [Salinibius halmophilus]|uniref:hypothetical protein n=1 Tax=Salinibius halmophilus TaxID=1853216 RepID=UPI0013149B2B|nr:hypothetical protein [Salinibius halmophilus]
MASINSEQIQKANILQTCDIIIRFNYFFALKLIAKDVVRNVFPKPPVGKTYANHKNQIVGCTVRFCAPGNMYKTKNPLDERVLMI